MQKDKKKGKRRDAGAAKKCTKKKSGGGGPKAEYRGKTSQGLPIVLEIGHRRADGHFDLRLPCYTNTGSGMTGPVNAVGKATLNGPANTDGTPPYGDFAGSFRVAIGGAKGNGKIFGEATKTKVSGEIRNEFAYTPTPGPGQVVCGTVNITYDAPTS